MNSTLKDQVSFLLIIISLLFIRRSTVLQKFAFIIKQNQILLQTVNKDKIKNNTTDYDRFLFHQIITDKRNSKINIKRLIKYLQIVKPETVLFKWKDIIKKRHTYPAKKPPGRPPISQAVRNLIIEIKKLNYLFGFKRISGELEKIDIDVSKSTVRRVIQQGRKDGDILPNGSWKKFISSHFQSLFCCDFFTVETVFQSKIFVFFILELKTRKIVKYGLTSNPNLGFVRNQLTSFMYDREDKETHLIHDNSGELKWFDYESVGINNVPITPYSPKAGRKLAFCSPMRPCMNAFAERFVRSAKNECMDHFVVFNQSQLRNLMREYVKYYNTLRPHQEIKNKIPDASVQTSVTIRGKPVLFGLFHSYYPDAS